jgi:hypothetical protein
VVSTGAATLAVCKCTSAQAATAGTTMTKTPAAFDLKSAVNTDVVAVLSDTPADYTLASGNRIGLKSSATTAGMIGGMITIKMRRA